MMPAPWKQWEGQVVDLYFPLHRYLGGTDRSAVYLTQYSDPEPRHAAIKLVLVEAPENDPEVQWSRAAQLSHPNILRLLRAGRWELNQFALRYAVIDYAEENLADVLAERALTASEVRDIVKPLLGALAYIHHEGLVHGHLKPANIMAVGDNLKLSVDGITLVGEPGAAPSASGPYDPPEFEERGSSPVGDVWSFGVTLVEALTRKLPTSAGPKQPPGLPEELPAEFLPIVNACLQPDPRRRATVPDLLELLERPQAAPAPSSAPTIEPAAQRSPRSRRWTGAALVFGSAIALAAVFAAPHLLRRPATNAPTEAAARVPSPVAAPAAAPPEVQASKPTPFAPPAQKPVEKPPAVEPSAPIVTRPAERPGTKRAEPVVESQSSQGVHQVLPDVPDYARRTIHGSVRIQVRATVDAGGRVTAAKVESQNSKYFAKLALEATHHWEFPASPGEWLVRYEFTTGGTNARPIRVGR